VFQVKHCMAASTLVPSLALAHACDVHNRKGTSLRTNRSVKKLGGETVRVHKKGVVKKGT
jgi:hypothetical protein